MWLLPLAYMALLGTSGAAAETNQNGTIQQQVELPSNESGMPAKEEIGLLNTSGNDSTVWSAKELQDMTNVGERVWVTLYQHGRYGSTRLRPRAFNEAFRRAGTGILRRQCSSCRTYYKDVYIKVREPMEWDAYTELLVTWSSSGFHSKFDLYSSLQGAISDENRWEFCNGGDPGIGFPRDCGVHRQTAVFYQWTSFTRGGQQDYMYSVLESTAMPAILLP